MESSPAGSPVGVALITPAEGLVVTMEYTGPYIGGFEEGLPAFETCWSGPAVCMSDPVRCRMFDWDEDGDVDQADFGMMQAHAGGSE